MLDMTKPEYACVEPIVRGNTKMTDQKYAICHPRDVRCKQTISDV